MIFDILFFIAVYHKEVSMFLSFLSYIAIPIYTFLFVKGYGWFTTNFSVIGNLHRKDAFVIWGILIGFYFYRVLREIVRHMKEKPRGTALIPLSLVLLFCAVTTPYLPELFPFKSFLHIVFAFLAAVCLLLCLYLIVWKLYRTDKLCYRPFFAALIGITAGSALLLVLVGIVSSALELFFTLTSVILARRLLGKVVKKMSEDATKLINF